MPTGKLTVIIPTYNRKAILKRVLQGYLHQSIASDSFEVLIIDDGSTDGTAQAVASISENSAIALRYHRQENKGPAAARNVGIREARGEVILFADDDIIPASDLIAEHWTWHRKHPEPNVAVLGYVTWAADVNATPFMKWYGEEGPLLAYKQFVGREELDFRFFYTSNLSLKSEFLRKNGTFDEEFKSAAFEDTELGYRLQKNGGCASSTIGLRLGTTTSASRLGMPVPGPKESLWLLRSFTKRKPGSTLLNLPPATGLALCAGQAN